MEAELWLEGLVSKESENAELREFLGQVPNERRWRWCCDAVRAALELRLAESPQGTVESLNGLYVKVKALTPANPLVTKLAAAFAPPPAPQIPEAPVPPSDGVDLETHYTLGVAYKNMGLLEEAKEEFSLSMTSPTVFLDSCLMTSVCLKEQGKPDEASALLERLVGDSRCQGAKAQAIRYELGLLYETQAQWQEAVSMFESIPTFHDVPERLLSIRTQLSGVPSSP